MEGGVLDIYLNKCSTEPRNSRATVTGDQLFYTTENSVFGTDKSMTFNTGFEKST